MDVAKRLLDYGYHAPTIYFPLLFHESLMVEPTENESKETLDGFISVMRKIAEEAKTDPEMVKSAPHTTPIGRVDDSIITRQVDFENGERAVTHYKVIDEKKGHSLISIHLETGRTHQIRVHFKYIGHPLIGDHLYNPDFEYMTRQALHSHKISFVHPITKKAMEFIAPLPNDMNFIYI
jgi:hypothetical protein